MSNYSIHDFKVASKVGSNVSDFTDIESKAPTDRCLNPRADKVYSKCYAIQELSISSSGASNGRYNINGISGTINFDDKDIEKGLNLALFWLKFNDDPMIDDEPIIIEVGIMNFTGDGVDSELTFTCVKDGYEILYDFETTPLNNTDYDFKMEEQQNGDWNLTVNGEHCYTLEDVPQNVYLRSFIRGTETTSNNIPDFIHEFDAMQMKWKHGWYYLQPFFGTDQRNGVKKEFFIDLCGIGIENMYHIETGKGVARNC